jgi:multisubunit Na+/H+ antiporter MnhG subunit
LCRAHALAKASTFGITLVLIALWIALGDDISRLKILLVIAFSLLTIPLTGHLIALLLYRHPSTGISVKAPDSSNRNVKEE